MTFEEWKASQPLQVRRDLYEHNWVNRLCREAWEAGAAHAKRELAELAKPLQGDPDPAWDRRPWRSYDCGQGRWSVEQEYTGRNGKPEITTLCEYIDEEDAKTLVELLNSLT